MNFTLQISSKCGQGEWVKKSEFFVDIINGSPLNRTIPSLALAAEPSLIPGGQH